MKKLLSSLLVFLLCASQASVSFAAGNDSLLRRVEQFGLQSITRAEFLAWSVEYLYGNVSNQVLPTGYDDTVIAIAEARDAFSLWGVNAKKTFGERVSRCQALQFLFRLADIKPSPVSVNEFTDVPAGEIGMAVRNAIEWNLITPAGSQFFGCRRSIRAEELATVLRGFSEHVSVPIDIPASVKSGVVIRKRPSSNLRRSRTAPETPAQPTTRVPVRTNQQSSQKNVQTLSQVQNFPSGNVLMGLWGLLSKKFLYLDKVDQQELGYKLAETLLSGMNDPYTVFMRPKRAEVFQTGLKGELSGIGARVEQHADGGIVVISPLTGSPALRSGLQPGDRIIEVDNESIIGLTLQDAVAKIRGPVGSEVRLTVERGGAKLIISVTRAKIVIPEVELSMQENVMHVRLMQFGVQTREELGKRFKAGIDQGAQALILDLRNNPGGYLETAIDVLGHFLPKDTVVTKIKSRGVLRGQSTKRARQVIPSDMPVAIIVNKGSASASEIVAGALQDLNRASIVGEQTFGKGSVQEVFQATEGWNAKYTIAEWMTPNERSIEKMGITPDVVIVDARKEGGRDEQLLKAMEIVQGKLLKR